MDRDTRKSLFAIVGGLMLIALTVNVIKCERGDYEEEYPVQDYSYMDVPEEETKQDEEWDDDDYGQEEYEIEDDTEYETENEKLPSFWIVDAFDAVNEYGEYSVVQVRRDESDQSDWALEDFNGYSYEPVEKCTASEIEMVRNLCGRKVNCKIEYVDVTWYFYYEHDKYYLYQI